MLILNNALLTPDIGLIFWTSIIFIALWVLLGKFAWRPIVAALHEREVEHRRCFATSRAHQSGNGRHEGRSRTLAQ